MRACAFSKKYRSGNFSLGTTWAPTANPPSFGIVPLLGGTLLITLIAILVAGPLGLLSAIYLAEYASPGVRAIAKPLLELLAGIPTVVLGFFRGPHCAAHPSGGRKPGGWMLLPNPPLPPVL